LNLLIIRKTFGISMLFFVYTKIVLIIKKEVVVTSFF